MEPQGGCQPSTGPYSQRESLTQLTATLYAFKIHYVPSMLSSTKWPILDLNLSAFSKEAMTAQHMEPFCR
jgi:hypothetical protein